MKFRRLCLLHGAGLLREIVIDVSFHVVFRTQWSVSCTHLLCRENEGLCFDDAVGVVRMISLHHLAGD